MTLFRNKYRIESTRLPGYDYSQPGAYFVTMVTKYRKWHFGCITNDKMILNDNGKTADNFWREISNHYPHVMLDEYVIMPNHIHGILIITDNFKINNDTVKTPESGVSTEININEESILKQPTLGVIINQFKRICTITIRQNHPEFAWQPRFYDHIIRTEEALNNIRQYIIDNPIRWEMDDENPVK